MDNTPSALTSRPSATAARPLAFVNSNASPMLKKLECRRRPHPSWRRGRSSPGASSNSRVSIPRSTLVMCSNKVSAP